MYLPELGAFMEHIHYGLSQIANHTICPPRYVAYALQNPIELE